MADSVSRHIELLIAEGAIGMAETARLIGTFREGKPCHSSTPTRWCLKGQKLANGDVLFLEHYRIAGRLMTSKAALLRFLAAQQGNLPVPPPRTPTQRNEHAEAAGRQLKSLGA